MIIEDEDDLDTYEEDEIDEEAEEYELGSLLPSDIGWNDPFDPGNQITDDPDVATEAASTVTDPTQGIADQDEDEEDDQVAVRGPWFATDDAEDDS